MIRTYQNRLIISLFFCAFLIFLASAQDQPNTSPENLRILFDSRGGFKVFHLDLADGSYHAMLNPAVDTPVNLEIYRNGTLLPLKIIEGAVSAQEGDPGFRGPAFWADDIRVQAWGLDLGKAGSPWSAIRYELTNTASTITTLNIRFILDTYLGESGREPLAVLSSAENSKTILNDETQIKITDQAKIIISSKPDGSDSIFFLMPGKNWPNITPQRIIVANVRRLQNSAWTYDTEEHRAFNLLPFSINDSALAYMFESEVLLPHQQVAIDLLVAPKADLDSATFSRLRERLAAINLSPQNVSSPQVVQTSPSTDNDRAAMMAKINQMIETLNNMMASQNYKQGDVERLIQAIDDSQNKLKAKP